MAEENQSPGLMSPASSMAVSMIDRFANPAAYFKQAREEGKGLVTPYKKTTEKEAEEMLLYP